MNNIEYLKSLSHEMEALKNRVRNFINDRHWLTDGEWKESVLKTFLRRNLPEIYNIGRGFIITDDSVSSQIDVLIYKNDSPVLFRDNDLVFLTSDSVCGIIEVKSKVTSFDIKDALHKLADIFDIIKKNRGYPFFLGLFVYEIDKINVERILSILQEIYQERKCKIDIMCLGTSRFIKFWDIDPSVSEKMITHNRWHSYKLDHLSTGYFLHNVQYFLSQNHIARNEYLWFPRDSKENKKDAEIGLEGK